MPSSVTKLRQPTEAQFTRQVIKFAALHGWRTAHFRPARTKDGWRTAVSGQGKGFPDLVLLKDSRIIIAELKVGYGKCTKEQLNWIFAWERTPAKCFIWRPEDWPLIEKELSQKQP